MRRLQDGVEASLTSVLDKLVVNGQLLEGIALAVGDNIIEHKLDRDLRGWFIVRASAGVQVYDKQDEDNLLTQRFLKLTSDATATVSIWVF
jgi:hypothetical protein